MGRRKKEVAVQAPKPTVKNAAYYKKIAGEIAQENANLDKALAYALEDKEYWFQIADKAHKENEAMLESVRKLVEDAVNTLIDVKVATDEITALDVLYNVSMINRIIEHKFNPITTEE